jgi:hypothetical protein
MRGVTPFEVRNGRIVSGRLYMEEVEERPAKISTKRTPPRERNQSEDG